MNGREWMDKVPRLPASVARIADFFCGCCTVEATWGAVRFELERLDAGIYDGNDGLAAALVYRLGLSEHGTSIRGGWLTPEGTEALAFLREHGIEWEDRGAWVGPDGCFYGHPDMIP